MIIQTSGTRIEITDSCIIDQTFMALSEGADHLQTKRTVQHAKDCRNMQQLNESLTAEDPNIETTIITAVQKSNILTIVQNCSSSVAVFGSQGDAITITGLQQAGLGFARLKDTGFLRTDYPVISSAPEVSYVHFAKERDFTCLASSEIYECLRDAIGPVIYVAWFIAENLSQFAGLLTQNFVDVGCPKAELVGNIVCHLAEEEGATGNCSVVLDVKGYLMPRDMACGSLESLDLLSVLNFYFQNQTPQSQPAFRIEKDQRRCNLSPLAKVSLARSTSSQYSRYLGQCSFDSQTSTCDVVGDGRQDSSAYEAVYNAEMLHVE
ncbi:hypothetical protein SS50377_26185 [Spironucleus salmonicida]|uniref:Uncharacterized protein n=1 Tax=Spironucleus salmonicida TaxID=348837 RepID=V6LJX8_9EUKA|nr:hypothetical protein SS50377_26182 [Spironucleus salmonicida]KAH0571985.1 hypothetical protein SS50377_26185 [Spironucleus salmonicida]|eukprot:EST44915.1 Hypothetical protein SS50377_15209 [Spironucleus salmonicida]